MGINTQYIALLSLLSISAANCADLPKGSDSSVGNATYILPTDLIQYGLEHDCLQISSFYKDRPRVDHPPYVYGLMTTKPDVEKDKNGKPMWFNDYSAAFWCRPAKGTTDDYTLLFDFNGGGEGMGSCPTIIEHQQSVGGLSVVELANESLSSYFDVVTREKYKGDDVAYNGPAIRSEYDGVGDVYICYKKRWLWMAFD